jgi:hypothetical protein
VTVTASGAATAATAPVPAARTARLYVPAGVAELVLTVTVLALTPFASDAGFAVAVPAGTDPSTRGLPRRVAPASRHGDGRRRILAGTDAQRRRRDDDADRRSGRGGAVVSVARRRATTSAKVRHRARSRVVHACFTSASGRVLRCRQVATLDDPCPEDAPRRGEMKSAGGSRGTRPRRATCDPPQGVVGVVVVAAVTRTGITIGGMLPRVVAPVSVNW